MYTIPLLQIFISDLVRWRHLTVTEEVSARTKSQTAESETTTMVQGSGKRKEISKLLFCACRDRCLNKTAPQSSTHKCPGCSVPIHPTCGFPDGDDPNVRWCHHCKVGQTPSPFQQITQRQALENNAILPRNIFDGEEKGSNNDNKSDSSVSSASSPPKKTKSGFSALIFVPKAL